MKGEVGQGGVVAASETEPCDHSAGGRALEENQTLAHLECRRGDVVSKRIRQVALAGTGINRAARRRGGRIGGRLP